MSRMLSALRTLSGLAKIRAHGRRWLACGVGVTLAAGLGFGLLQFSFGLGLRQWSYDLLHVFRGDHKTSGVVIVYLDERSHLELNQPLNRAWDRSLHARFIDRMTRAGARAVVMDIVFSDPNPDDPEGDQRLIRAVTDNGRVVLAADNVRTGPRTRTIIPPFEELLDAAAGVGSAEVLPGRDLIVREHTPREQIPSLSGAAAEFLGVEAAREADGSAARWVHYYGAPNVLPWVSYFEALDASRVPDEFFRDQVVFVGARLFTKFAGDRKDEYRNPYSHFLNETLVTEREGLFTAGVEIQATAFLNLWRGDWLTRFPGRLETLLTLLAGAGFGLGLVLLRPTRAAGLAALGAALVAGGSYFLFARHQIWFPWIIVLAQIGTALSWGTLYNAIQLYVQKRMYEHTLGLYLSPKLVRKFSNDARLLKPGAEEQLLTIMFTDIEDFTRLSQQISSEELVQLMNGYFQRAVSDCIHPTDGTVVKYIGDAIFAFWNAPELQSDHAYRACQAALRMRDRNVHEIRGRPLRTRIGIHTGPARVGNFGSEDRVDYTALGESVNLASRLEGVNKFLSTTCLISQETRDAVGDRLVTRDVGVFQVKGVDKPVGIHELVGEPEAAKDTEPWRQSFEQALANYRSKDLELAQLGFRQTLEIKPHDGPSLFYLSRIHALGPEPVPVDWDGRTQLWEK